MQFRILTTVNKAYCQKMNFHVVAIIKPFQDLWYSKNKKSKWHIADTAKGQNHNHPKE